MRGPDRTPGPERRPLEGLRILYLTDRLSVRGGAGRHLLQVIRSAETGGARVTVASGRAEPGSRLPDGAAAVTVRGLGAATATNSRLGRLPGLLAGADVVHVQNVMNPVALAQAAATGHAVVTVQDHRLFCPGPGKTLPDGARCSAPMDDVPCAECLPKRGYRRRLLELTAARRDSVRGARLIVLSRYMADELAAAGLPGAEVIPPWVAAAPRRNAPGNHLVLAGRLVLHKAPLDGQRAWDAAGRPLPLRVAGAGPLAGRLQGATLLGWLDSEAFASELAGARALLFPARWQEPFGIVGVETLAQGTPVVVADVGGTRDWSNAGCFRVPPGDTTAMAAAIRRLSDDPDLALDLGERGRNAVAELFSRPRLEPRLDAVYARTAGGG